MSDGRLSEHAVFEVADIVSAASLAMNLAWRWDVIVSVERPEATKVVVKLRPTPSDLAALLREVEDWVEENSVCALRFEVDGRAYVLEAGEPDWSVDLTGTRDGIALTGR